MAELISSIEQVTPEWVTESLKQATILRAGRVTDVQVASSARSASSEMYTLQLKYSGLKTGNSKLESLTTPVPPLRLYLKFGAGGENEVVFYNATREANYVNRLPIIPCYSSVYAPEINRYHILMKDLTGTHFPLAQEPLPPLNAQGELALAWLARLHACFWEHAQLGNGIGSIPPVVRGVAPYRDWLQDTQKQYIAFADFMGERLTPALRQLYERTLAFLPSLGEEYWRPRLNEVLGLTLIHGEARTANILFPRDPQQDRVYLVGWHSHRVGIGAADLAWLVSFHWYADRQRSLPFLKRYFSALQEYGVKGYDWDVFWVDYRLALVNALLEPVRLQRSGAPAAEWYPLLERGAQAYREMECAELVEAG